jgi:tetratricopeptide (TPR) repeat protein
VLTAEGDLSHAELTLRQALQQRQNSGEKGLVAETSLTLAEVLINEKQFIEAESLTRQALSEFHIENESDDEAAAEALLARCLLEKGNLSTARNLATHALKLIAKSKDRSETLFTLIQCARVQAAGGSTSRAVNSLNSAIAEANHVGFLGAELEGRLALGEIEAKQKMSIAAVHLQAVAKKAQNVGFGYISQQAERYETLLASAPSKR